MGGSEKVPADNNADLCVGFCSSLAVSNASLLARKEVQGAFTLEGESQLPADKRVMHRLWLYRWETGGGLALIPHGS